MLLSVHHDVRCAEDLLGAQGPDVKVVDGVHLGYPAEVSRQLGLVNVPRGLHHQGADGAHYRGLRSEQHEDSEEDRATWVRVVPLADAVFCQADVEGLNPDAEGREADAQGLYDVAYDVGHGRLYGRSFVLTGIPAMAVAMIIATVVVPMTQDLHQHEVHDEADDADCEHERRIDWLRVGEAVHSLPDQHRCEGPHDHHGEQRP
mmetsp:Transcript_93042/g.199542  ORF Transcript_93042/g.199542 Transcript_93042/m.199542 type:complete len:204 (+) Transcript_93042:313-924(+)